MGQWEIPPPKMGSCGGVDLALFAVSTPLSVRDSGGRGARRRGATCSSTTSMRQRRADGDATVFSAAKRQLNALKQFVEEVESRTRPGSVAGAEGAMKDRYEKLPSTVKVASQMLGRLSPGCEGTNGVFPKCNFGCQPCYHSKSANKVPVDGGHTAVEVARQMALLRAQRGGVAHAQLIGGEVTLLGARAHATALEVMAYYGRIPMSFTHGDFDYDYLVALATHGDGRRRFARLDFAAHFDKYMRGRRGLPAPTTEAQLNEYRRRFLGMFERLRREHGVRSYCAHNMTVQRGNVGEVAQVVSDILGFECGTNFRMLSFQPASETGARRVVGESVSGDDVWREIERGAGVRLPYRLFTMGHPACNRVCFCARFGAVVVPFFDDTSAEDATLRDHIIGDFGNIVLPQWLLFLKIARVAVLRPRLLGGMVRWVGRFMRRCGDRGVVLSREISRLGLITFVMHSFMDASQVSEAWDLIERGYDSGSAAEVANDETVETMERLLSCSYGMAKAEEGRVIPACVQHAVYDEEENVRLADQLGQR